MSKEADSYFDHDADIGIIGRGKSIEEAFISGAETMFAIMADIFKIQPQQSISIEFEETDLEFAFITWLNQLIAKSRATGLVFGHFELHRHQGHWQGKAFGEPWRDDLERGTEVKGATLTMLQVHQEKGVWEVRCVVDV